jgi:alpha/beta superfamily hydrolase
MAASESTYGSGFITNRRGRRLFYAEHHPEAIAGDGPVWVLCSPILEEKNVSQGLFVNLARALTTIGTRVLRIDYEGHGDSEGDTAELGLTDWADDVVDAVAWLRADGRTDVVLLGCRAGALIAALAARVVSPACVLAWSPIAGGPDDVQALLRLNLATQLAVEKAVVRPRDLLEDDLQNGGIVNVLGWSVGRPLYESLTAIDFTMLVASLPCPVEIIDVSMRPGDATREAADAGASGGRVVRRAVAGRQFWIDSNIVDLRQPALVAATLEVAASVVPS